ncbi:GNAT family N-acetyltransferase [Polynucleobacter sp. MWH-Braz-FAM2G]|uniref:GNAT family N-acetyltransferase n=1 Tax=Polynucleobacter sp. MWH-Braz-FAM2G TaxID=1855883 RepID=UPI00203C19BE|nr:GNAT family N-acetyltransferase [Polynucleobacter sp. MWH-Braz-FAM2G]
MDFNALEIAIKTWQDAKKDAFFIRETVFIQEQGVPAALEIDEYDPSAAHALAFEGAECVGTGRLVKLGVGEFQIGKMAVLARFRGRGIGKQILKKLVDLARTQGAIKIILHSQISAIPFYEKLGFQATGPGYDEAGITHRNMILVIAP